MILGEWGSGKTHVVREFFRREKANSHDQIGVKHLEISLFGMKSQQQISDAIFQGLHPILGSAPVRFVGDVLKGVLKANIKLDLLDSSQTVESSSTEVDSDATVDVGASLEKLKIPQFLNNPDGYILVFDDFERCLVPMEELLGYLYSLVEFSNQKVIVIANQNKIGPNSKKSKKSKKNEKSEKYRIFMEFSDKLFGRTIVIEPDLESAIKTFVREESLSKSGESLKNNEALIADVFQVSGTNNLRLLQRILWDWEILFSGFNVKIKENENLVKDLLNNFVTLQFVHQQNSLTDGVLVDISKMYGIDDEDKDRFRKFPLFRMLRLILSSEKWEKILDGKHIVSETLQIPEKLTKNYELE